MGYFQQRAEGSRSGQAGLLMPSRQAVGKPDFLDRLVIWIGISSVGTYYSIHNFGQPDAFILLRENWITDRDEWLAMLADGIVGMTGFVIQTDNPYEDPTLNHDPPYPLLPTVPIDPLVRVIPPGQEGVFVNTLRVQGFPIDMLALVQRMNIVGRITSFVFSDPGIYSSNYVRWYENYPWIWARYWYMNWVAAVEYLKSRGAEQVIASRRLIANDFALTVPTINPRWLRVMIDAANGHLTGSDPLLQYGPAEDTRSPFR